MDKFNTNSEVGSIHWFNTLMGQAIRMSEFVGNYPTHEKVKEYGNKTKEILLHISDNLKTINNTK